MGSLALITAATVTQMPRKLSLILILIRMPRLHDTIAAAPHLVPRPQCHCACNEGV